MTIQANTIITYLKKRPLYDLNRQAFLKDNRLFLWIAAIIFVVVLLIRSWGNFSHPALYAEDATYYFKLNYDAPFSVENIFRNPNGYYNIFNNFIAQIISMLDVRIQPLAYQSVALIVSVSTVILFSRIGLVTNRYLLLITPLILGLSGLNHVFYYITITFQMYVLVLTLFLVLLWQQPPSLSKNVLIFLLVPLLIWSGPYSVLAVPFALVFMVLFRGKDLLMIWIITVTIVYALSTTGSSGSTIELQHIFSRTIQDLWFKAIVGDVFIMGLRGNVNLEKVFLLIGIFGPAIYFIRRNTFHLKILTLLMVLIVSSMAPLFLSNKFMFYRTIYPCHLLIAQFFWILFVIILLDRIIHMISDRYRPVATVVTVILLLSFVVVDNLRNEENRKIDILYNMPEFLRTIHEYEQRNLAIENEFVEIRADGSGIFAPIARVGSRAPDAKRIKRILIEAQPERLE